MTAGTWRWNTFAGGFPGCQCHQGRRVPAGCFVGVGIGWLLWALVKFVRSSSSKSEVRQKIVRSSSKVRQKCVRSSSKIRQKFVRSPSSLSEVRQVRQKFVKSSSSLSQVRQIRRRPGWGSNWESKQLIFLILVGKTAYFFDFRWPNNLFCC